MKTSKLRNLAWAFFALALGTTSVFAQNRGNGNRGYNNQNQVCLEQISDLSGEQKSKIQELENTHQKEMAELREKRQSTADAIEKSEIRTTMLKNAKSHRELVKSLLTAEQQKEYELFETPGNNYGNQRGNENFQGCRQCRGQQFAGNYSCGARGKRGGGGQGNGYGNRQNRGCYRN